MELYFSNADLDEQPDLSDVSADALYLNDNNIRTLWLEYLPIGLKYLHIENNNLLSDSFPEELPDSLVTISASNNEIVNTDIYSWGENLREINFSNNPLAEIPENLPDTVERINVSNTFITEIVKLPENCKKFTYYTGFLEVLPATWPLHIEELYLADNKLTSIGDISYLPLKILNCSKNFITEFPVLPDTLEHLKISWNKLTTISNIPASLRTLYAQRNKIRTAKLKSTLLLCDLRNNCLVSDIEGRNIITTDNWNTMYHFTNAMTIQKAWHLYKMFKGIRRFSLTNIFKRQLIVEQQSAVFKKACPLISMF